MVKLCVTFQQNCIRSWVNIIFENRKVFDSFNNIQIAFLTVYNFNFMIVSFTIHYHDLHSHTIFYYRLPSVNSQTLTDHTHYHACSIQALEWLRLQSLSLFCCTYTTYPLAPQHCLTNHDLHSMILTPCLPLDN